ncbi:hypothetical protein SAMN05216573_113123 [Bradyrhizobium sp. Rc3b]|nr:hypothetical protein [Bradyrhizobium sp. SBR1B]SFN45162.1 hypothetical protein SAMN05216573_113123 [Bradyrhizobium sp. Rc3b]
MRFFQMLLIFLASAEPGAFAKSAPHDPRPNSECLVSAAELPPGAPRVMCPTRSSPGSFCVCPRFSKNGNKEGYYTGTAK